MNCSYCGVVCESGVCVYCSAHQGDVVALFAKRESSALVARRANILAEQASFSSACDALKARGEFS